MLTMRGACVSAAVVFAAVGSASAQNLLSNGNLDRVTPAEIVPGFFLPKPSVWVHQGSRAISGPYQDEMSSEPWSGPAPTPVTADGFMNAAPYNSDGDYGVFFKAFSGNITDGAATGHLYQDVPGIAGNRYTMTGWAGAEANLLVQDVQFAIEFRDGVGGLIGSATLSLLPQLFVPNGQPFNYKQFMLDAVAPAGTATVRARVSMVGGLSNPAGGGQALVVDDFSLTTVPGPGTGVAVMAVGGMVLGRRRRR